MIKEEIRILGIDDGYFDRNKNKYDLIVGVIMRGYKQIDGVLSEYIEIDGDDVTDKIIKMIFKTKNYKQLRIVMTNGITFGGFNVLDIEKLYNNIKLPIIILIRKKPNMDNFLKALKKYKNFDEKFELIKKAGEIKSVKTKYGITYFQNIGINDDIARDIIIKTAKNSRIPEPVRVAHLIAMGVTKGYSRGKP